VLLGELVSTSEAVAAAGGRRVKIQEMAGLLRRATAAEMPVAVAYLSGELPQRQIGVGYATLGDLLRETPRAAGGEGSVAPDTVRRAVGDAAPAPGLTLIETDAAFSAIGAVRGPGTQGERRRLLGELFRRATVAERSFLVRLLSGDLRQGALQGLMAEAVAHAAGVPAGEVRRAHLLDGSLAAVAVAALAVQDPADALSALRSFTLRVGRPLRPMLAAAAPDMAAAFGRAAPPSHGTHAPAAVEWKIDGIRVQVHRNGPDVAVFTRTLDDITARVPEITEAVRSLPVGSAVLDGEAVALGTDGRPRPFQVTAARTGSRTDVDRQRREVPLTPFFFDLLHLDGTDLIDSPAGQRHAMLSGVVPGELLIPRIVTDDAAVAGAFFQDAVALGHEGVVVKSLAAPYAAGRRGSEWIKVKPRHTLDLVVLAAEWGHGRRRGWLSNLHLGAPDPAAGSLVMLGKTFKGLTDEMLTWQTARLLELADPPQTDLPEDLRQRYGTVRVRPELVVEIAFDGVQTSPRYPGGIALRFARVIRYRLDKHARDADTIDAVRAIRR
jgi:DNA ligase-1